MGGGPGDEKSLHGLVMEQAAKWGVGELGVTALQKFGVDGKIQRVHQRLPV